MMSHTSRKEIREVIVLCSIYYKCGNIVIYLLSQHWNQIFLIINMILGLLTLVGSNPTGPNVCITQNKETVRNGKDCKVRNCKDCQVSVTSIYVSVLETRVHHLPKVNRRTQVKVVDVPICCENYTLNDNGDGCIPICDQECINGLCMAPNDCRCDEGFIGDSCDIALPITFINFPNCNNNTVYNVETGKCECSSGWQGFDCSQRICSKNMYGKNCNQTCECIAQNTDYCDPVSGNCICKSNWRGSNCDQSLCDCKNEGECNSDNDIITKGKIGNDTCKCKPGFKGKKCDEFCSTGTFGQDCSEKCNCNFNNTIQCDAVDGSCTCKDNWFGSNCNITSTNIVWNDKQCKCHNNGTCTEADGSCICTFGWGGKSCQTKCDKGFYGPDCAKECLCSTEKCNTEDDCSSPYQCVLPILPFQSDSECITILLIISMLIILILLITIYLFKRKFRLHQPKKFTNYPDNILLFTSSRKTYYKAIKGPVYQNIHCSNDCCDTEFNRNDEKFCNRILTPYYKCKFNNKEKNLLNGNNCSRINMLNNLYVPEHNNESSLNNANNHNGGIDTLNNILVLDHTYEEIKEDTIDRYDHLNFK